MTKCESAFLVVLIAAILGTATMCGYMHGKEEMRGYYVLKVTDRR